MRTQKPKRKKARANGTLAYGSSALSMATHNLVNMVVITLLSGGILLALLTAKHLRYDGLTPMSRSHAIDQQTKSRGAIPL